MHNGKGEVKCLCATIFICSTFHSKAENGMKIYFRRIWWKGCRQSYRLKILLDKKHFQINIFRPPLATEMLLSRQFQGKNRNISTSWGRFFFGCGFTLINLSSIIFVEIVWSVNEAILRCQKEVNSEEKVPW